MTLVACPPHPLGFIGGPGANELTTTLDANNEKVAWIGYAPKTGTIDRFGFRVATATVGDTVDVRVETVVDGLPSGALWATDTNVAQVILLTDDNIWFEVTFTAGASVTRGDKLAIVIAFPAVAVGNLNIYRINTSMATFPYTALYTGSWARSAAPLAGFLRYSDGTYPFVPGLVPAIIGALTYNNTSTPDERGAKITVPYACKVGGIWVDNISIIALGDFDLVLYDSNDNVLESVSVDGGYTEGISTPVVPMYWMFDTEVTLKAGDVVRAVKKPTSATNADFRQQPLQSAAVASAFIFGANSVLTTRTDAGAWTETTTTIPLIGLIVTAQDDGQNRGGHLAVVGSAVARSVI